MFGVSVFLGEALTIETKAYLQAMKDSGFEGVFTSVHIPEEDASQYVKRLKTLGEWTEELGMQLVVDSSGEALRKIGFSFERPEEMLAIGITGLRMDYGITNQISAQVSQSMMVAFNASTITQEDVEELQQFHANFDQMEAWHNYYPRPETGLEKESFSRKNQWLKALGFRVMAFVPGNETLRGPLFSQLPTLEKHRGLHPLASTIELLEDCAVDAVYIGDPTIDDRTKQQFFYYIKKQTLLFSIEEVPETNYLAAIVGNHQNRWDAARDVIRSADARFKTISTIEPQHTNDRVKGSITLDNKLYGRYMGEIQLVKRPLFKDEKVNIVAHVIPEDLSLIDWCKAGQLFELQPIQNNERG